MDLLFRIIDAIGSVATAIAVILALTPFKTKMKISGDFSLRRTDVFVISVANTRNRDNEIKSITFYKGNPKKSDGYPFYSVDLNEYETLVSTKTNNIVVPKESSIDITVSCKCIACNYEKIGEAIGTPFESIFVLLRDIKGNTYSINTGVNADYYRKMSNEVTTYDQL